MSSELHSRRWVVFGKESYVVVDAGFAGLVMGSRKVHSLDTHSDDVVDVVLWFVRL